MATEQFTETISMYNGDDVDVAFTVWQDRNAVPRVPEDTTNWTFRLTVKVNAEDTAIVFQITSHTVVDAPNGQNSISIAKADTLNVTAGKYVYDIEGIDVDAGNKVKTVAKGEFNLWQGVTT